MMQSTLTKIVVQGLHVGIIMDGNGRWAAAKGWQRVAGHKRGAQSVRHVVEAAPDLGIGTLTLYAFSSDNWQRPEREVSVLMSLLKRYLQSETANCVANGVRISIIGRRDRLDPALLSAITAAENATLHCTTLHLRLAIDYSAREAIVRAAQRLASCTLITRDLFADVLARDKHDLRSSGDVDLIIRTGGEQRLSDFLLWESAYAELYFTNRMWPEFGAQDLREAITALHSRVRRFGRVEATAAAAS
jgi:undecaprenyl diphosphate synthase